MQAVDPGEQVPGPVRRPRGVRRNEAQMDLAFVAPVLATPTAEIRGMVRGEGSIETQAAAVRARSTRVALQERILEILATEGPMNDRQLETRNEFRGYAPSTVRKRRSELLEADRIVAVGRHEGMAVWDLAPSRP
jgi:hypothetical protein